MLKITKIWHIPRLLASYLIVLYQRTISPDHGILKKKFPYGYCPYKPTCSEYGRQVILKKGLILGLILTSWRILRCNPWTKGGFDPVD